MRRISLSLLAGVALLGVTVVLIHAASASLSQSTLTQRTSAQLVAVAPAGLTRTAPHRRFAPRPDLKQTLAHLLATETMFGSPSARRARAITVGPQIRPATSQGMTCQVATSSTGGGCSIVPCAVYVGAGQTSYAVASGRGLGLAVLPSVTPKPSPGGRTPAGTCVSRPGRPPRMRWVGSVTR